MSFDDAFSRTWREGGHAAALAFLRGIFHDPDNQKILGQPTDYLNDEDDEQVSPAEGFDKLVGHFDHRWMERDELLEFLSGALVESRSPGTDAKHGMQPFNALLVGVETYGHGEANISSLHVAGESWKTQYGLGHQVIGEEDNYDPDDDDAYDFIYELEDDERYALRYDGEVVDGEKLFKCVRMAQYAGIVEGLIDDLFGTEAFASFPKTLPFRCYVTDDRRNDDASVADWFLVGEWTETDFADHPLRDVILAAAEPPPEPTEEEKWVYLLGFINDGTSDEFASLLELLDRRNDLRDATLAMAEARLGGTEPPDALEAAWRAVARKTSLAWVLLLWRLNGMEGPAADYTRRTLETIRPDLSEVDPDRVPRHVTDAWQAVSTVWDLVPDKSKELVRDAYEGARSAIREQDHPVVRVLFIERDLREQHGEDAVDVGYSEVSYRVDVPDELVSALIEVVGLLPEKFGGRGGLWDFVMPRLEGLGARAAAAAPAVEELLHRYAASRQDENLLNAFARTLYGMGLESPPAPIREFCEKWQYHMIDVYKPWAERVPRLRWERFESSFSAAPNDFRRPEAWDEVLVDTEMARTLFVKGFQEHEGLSDIVDALADAVPQGSQALRQLVVALIKALDRGRHGPDDIEKTRAVVKLAAALPARDEAENDTLKRARFLIARFDVDAGGDGGLDALLEEFPGDPMLLFMKAEVGERASAPEAAGQATVAGVRELSADDMVYRKAFFQMTGVTERSWDAAEAWNGLVAFRWAQEHTRQKHYRGGVFAGGQSAMLHDPFYDGLEHAAVKLGLEQFEDAWREAKLEISLGEELLTLSTDALAERLTPESWNVTLRICRALAPMHKTFGSRLLEAYEWFRGDEDRRMDLATTLWQQEGFREVLLADERFAQDLAWLVRRYPGVGTTEMARTVLEMLTQIGESRRALDLAEEMPAKTVMGCFFAVNGAIEQFGAYREGADLLKRFQDETSEKNPEYMLLGSNIGVLLFRGGDAGAAEASFDELFAKDWSRFEYRTSDKDEMMAQIMGGSLDAEVANVFWQYFAMAKFNAACVYANGGRLDDSVEALRLAWERVPDRYTVDKYEAEEDLAPLRASAAYATLLAMMGGAR